MADGWTLADAASSRHAGASCFGESARPTLPVEPMSLALTAPHLRAFAELLPLLLCGEESAVLAFACHAQLDRWGLRARQDFARIESDEERHTYWLQRLRASLPAPRTDSRLRRGVKHFFLRQSSPNLGIHLGHIAALDSAVCLILGRLRRTNACASDARVAYIFEHIHRDEARHVAIAGHYARERCSARDLFACATETREQLTSLMSAGAGALDTLEVCPDTLFRQLRRPPRRLFR
jgi:hypothetical protein